MDQAEQIEHCKALAAELSIEFKRVEDAQDPLDVVWSFVMHHEGKVYSAEVRELPRYSYDANSFRYWLSMIRLSVENIRAGVE